MKIACTASDEAVNIVAVRLFGRGATAYEMDDVRAALTTAAPHMLAARDAEAPCGNCQLTVNEADEEIQAAHDDRDEARAEVDRLTRERADVWDEGWEAQGEMSFDSKGKPMMRVPNPYRAALAADRGTETSAD